MGKTQMEQIREHHLQFRTEIQRIGDELRDKAMPVATEELFSEFEDTGNRLNYENVYFERRRYLAVFGLLSAWYKKPEDVRKLEEVIEGICQEETWALPAHVNRKSDPDWRRTADLFACETGQALANILDLTKGSLSKDLADKVKGQVIYRVLDSWLGRPKGSWSWENAYNNWVAVCAGCLGSIALFLLEDDKEKQQKAIDRVCDTLPNYIDGMCEDGTCPEGLSYFTYGMVFFTGFARQLYDHTGGRVDLMDSDKVRAVARFQQKCYLPGGNTVSFSDGDRADRFRLGLTCYLAGHVDGVEIPDISAAMDFETDHCYRFMGNLQDDVWVREYLEKDSGQKKQEPEWFTLLPDAQWAVWKNKDLGIAFKGGANGESHNHNDVGSFLLSMDGEIFLTDLGCGEYTRQYFRDETRYQILCNRSEGHSVPIINGQEQRTGAEYGAGSFVCEQPGRVDLEYAGAYEKDAGWKLSRRLECYEGSREMVITDSVSGSGVSRFEENLVTQRKVSVNGSEIVLEGKKGRVILTLSGNEGAVNVIREVFLNHHGVEEDVWLIRFAVDLNAGEKKCVIRCRCELGG